MNILLAIVLGFLLVVTSMVLILDRRVIELETENRAQDEQIHAIVQILEIYREALKSSRPISVGN